MFGLLCTYSILTSTFRTRLWNLPGLGFQNHRSEEDRKHISEEDRASTSHSLQEFLSSQGSLEFPLCRTFATFSYGALGARGMRDEELGWFRQEHGLRIVRKSAVLSVMSMIIALTE